MKSIGLIFLAVILSHVACGQQTVKIRNLWARAQVHVIFGEYSVSFCIKDINKALQLLRETGDSFFVAQSGLDTAKDYYYELFPGTHTEYHDTMQPVLQNLVGCFLLSAGHALVERNNKPLRSIIMDIGEVDLGEPSIFVSFFDPKTKTMLFSGKMQSALYLKDLGIDDQ